MSVFANGKEQPPCSTKRGAHLEFLRGGRGDLGEDCPQALKNRAIRLNIRATIHATKFRANNY